MTLNKIIKNHAKERGFTLLEVLITMVLTSILISISALAFKNITNLYHAWDERRRFIEDFALLQGRLNYAQKETLYMSQMSENKYELHRVSTPLLLEFTTNSIILSDKLMADTFQMSAMDVEIFPDDICSLLTGIPIVDRLTFTVGIQQQIYRLDISVKSSANAILALTRNDIQ